MKIKAELDLNINTSEQKRICIHYLKSLLPGTLFEEYTVDTYDEKDFWFKQVKDGYGKFVGLERMGSVSEVDKCIITLLEALNICE